MQSLYVFKDILSIDRRVVQANPAVNRRWSGNPNNMLIRINKPADTPFAIINWLFAGACKSRLYLTIDLDSFKAKFMKSSSTGSVW